MMLSIKALHLNACLSYLLLMTHGTNGFVYPNKQKGNLLLLPFKRGNSIHKFHAFNMDQIEADAVNAAEMWDISSTSFLSREDAELVKSQLGDRGDIQTVCIPGISSNRCRFAFTNPELVIDMNEYCSVLQVKNASFENCDPWPNMLHSIGIEIHNVGDIVISSDNTEAFLTVDPSVAKTITRLLPKVLVGTGVSISEVTISNVPIDGKVEDMELQRLDKRQQKRK